MAGDILVYDPEGGDLGDRSDELHKALEEAGVRDPSFSIEDYASRETLAGSDTPVEWMVHDVIGFLEDRREIANRLDSAGFEAYAQVHD